MVVRMVPPVQLLIEDARSGKTGAKGFMNCRLGTLGGLVATTYQQSPHNLNYKFQQCLNRQRASFQIILHFCSTQTFSNHSTTPAQYKPTRPPAA
ncbi:hypothetical protein FGO68_gene12139 [Halteria grandinella]|uniref:Uncharacterized protein n=1 Tax=Halteria grandinella TaxID=5974 RepID=A0A8J8NE96_HALGN|nr:hypothetical protein FGO68_gene12139 [Halteria grandinella]